MEKELCCSTRVCGDEVLNVDIGSYLRISISFSLMAIGLVLDFWVRPVFFQEGIRFVWYMLAYLPVGWAVIWKGLKLIYTGQVFTEFFLMSLATIGAFAVGQYPEAVAVMLFYTLGESLQERAIFQAKKSIKTLINARPNQAYVRRGLKYEKLDPSEVIINDIIQVKVGEKVALDGIMLSERSSFNTVALTGESKPRTVHMNGVVLAGMVNLEKVVELRVNKLYQDSALANVLALVQEAASRKAPTELFIRNFAKVYTPLVAFLALVLCVSPYFFMNAYHFYTWLYRSLVFLVISCPCALVISIPLGYFGGIGAASKQGILFKGSNYLDLMAKVNALVFDKTGTLTKGTFTIQKLATENGINPQVFINSVASLEQVSTHPIARAITAYVGEEQTLAKPFDVEEIAGQGLKGRVGHQVLLVGNVKLLKTHHVPYDKALDQMVETVVVVAIDGKFAGYLVIADEIKESALETIKVLRKKGIKDITMLSGDKTAITQSVAKKIGIEQAYGDLLPEEKMKKIESMRSDKRKVIAFVGDGFNDAPALALSHVGIAMGVHGSDTAIEVADVVIQSENPYDLVKAISISFSTKKIIYQNIALAFGTKALVLVLGATGLATMWEAVFADVGVAILAIINATRIQKN